MTTTPHFVLNNKWSEGKTTWKPINLPEAAKQQAGVIPLNVILNENVGTEVILCIFDPTDFIYQIANLNPFTLYLRNGLVRTSFGPVFFMLYWIPDPGADTPFVVFEQTLNPHEPRHLIPYYDLARQAFWHVFIIDREGKELNWFEFENTYGLSETIETAKKATLNMPCKDFNKAKLEYSQRYTVNDLLAME